jgi:hypothetical protein
MIDKITILEIKAARMSDPVKVENVRKELDLLNGRLGVARANVVVGRLTDDLRDVNAALWDIEDEIRDCEREQDFGARFVELARSVYFTNDKRADLKRQINLELASDIIEEKSYKSYTPT